MGTLAEPNMQSTEHIIIDDAPLSPSHRSKLPLNETELLCDIEEATCTATPEQQYTSDEQQLAELKAQWVKQATEGEDLDYSNDQSLPESLEEMTVAYFRGNNVPGTTKASRDVYAPFNQ